MAGILGQGWDDPQSAANMALAAGLVAGNFGGGLQGYGQVMAGAKKDALQQRMLEMQMQNMQSEIEARKLASIKDARQQALIESFIGGAPGASGATGAIGGGASGAPGGAAGGAANVMQLSQQLGIPPQAIQADIAFNGGKKISEMLADRSKPNWQNINGNLVNTNAPGFQGGLQAGVSAGNGGQVTMWQPDGRGGLVVGAPAGALDTYGAYQRSNGIIGAATKAAGEVNLREMPDGTKVPVPLINELPGLQPVLSGGTPGAAPVQPRSAFPTPNAPQQAAPTAAMPPAQPGMTGNFKGPVEDAVAAINQMRDPQERANAMAALIEQARRTPDFASKGFGAMPPQPASLGATSAPGTPAAGIGYGISTAQGIANKAAEARAVKQAETDVRSTDSRKNDVASANYMLSVIDQTLKHPGLPTGTGLSGTLDPRNYIPGTDAKGFQALLDQVKGGTFLQAYTNLKGSGAITDIEGTKATNALARLNTAQSTGEVVKALNEFREIVQSGLARQQGSNAAAGVPGNFAGDNSNFVNNGRQSSMGGGGWSATVRR